jgi:parallel beta-helix repeat protein
MDHIGIYSFKKSRITIKDLEIYNFCKGIYFNAPTSSPSKYNRLEDLHVHHNGNKRQETNDQGMLLVNFDESKITHCTVHDNEGAGEGCEDGGNGIYLYGPSADNNIITRNDLYSNRKGGYFQKQETDHNTISYNSVSDNGQGGIILRCKLSNDNIVEHNDVSGNHGDGIFIGGSDNIIRYNVVLDNMAGFNIDSKDIVGNGDGIDMGRSFESNDNSIYNNTACENEGSDIVVSPGSRGNEGKNNTCDSTKNYDDDDSDGCAKECSEDDDVNQDEEDSQDQEDEDSDESTFSTTVSTSTLSGELTVLSPPKVNPQTKFKVNVEVSSDDIIGAAFDVVFDDDRLELLSVDEGAIFKRCDVF